jgi:hypothetical protein
MGAFTNEGLYWLSPKGKTYTVNSLNKPRSMSHEEYANMKWHISLEDALDKGFIRVQAVAPQYLFIQHTQPQIKSVQDSGLWNFFAHENQVIPYGRILVERAGKDIDWKNGVELNNPADYVRAYEFTKTGTVPAPEEMSAGGTEKNQPVHMVGGKPMWQAHQDRTRDISQLHPFYQNRTSPLGDWTLSFKNWFSECTKKQQNTGST